VAGAEVEVGMEDVCVLVVCLDVVLSPLESCMAEEDLSMTVALVTGTDSKGEGEDDWSGSCLGVVMAMELRKFTIWSCPCTSSTGSVVGLYSSEVSR
jgi:hypothetical protein